MIRTKMPHRFTYTNATGGPIRVLLEPWAEQYIIQPGQRVEAIIVGSDEIGVLEFVQNDDMFVIYGYTGSVITLFTDGKELMPDAQIG